MTRNPQQDRKQQRLEAALRENLKRRKAQGLAQNEAQENLGIDPLEIIEPGPDSH